MRFRSVFVVAILALAIYPVGQASAQDGAELVSARLQIQGAQLTIFHDGVSGVDDADQVLNVAEPGRVRTCYGGVVDACGTIETGDPRVAGLVVRGELSGPELPTPRTIETVPGGAFHLPGFQIAGTYILQNIRLVEDETDRVVGYSQPSFALLDVHQIVLTSASVSQLSLDDLRERGIELGRENFQAFSFLVGFAVDGHVVEFEMPILYEDNGSVQQLDSPDLAVDGLPPDTVDIVERWVPPHIVPFGLRLPDDEWLEPKDEGQILEFPLFGAIVVPGTVTFLNQFFDAQMVVANGAPAGSGVQLSELAATITLPSGDPLRLHGSVPATSRGLPVPIVDAQTQAPLIEAATQGVASWTLEGLTAGTHVVAMKVDGRILRPGRDPLPVTSRVQAAVDVVDPRFHLTFSHPGVVREGFEYSLFVTVANRSAATQNVITLNLREESITGAHKADPGDDFVRTIESIPPGGSETVEFPLVADLTGEVVAATFVTDGSVASGSFDLYTGVGDLGIPLSPATLLLPRHAERLSQPWMSDDGFWVAFMRFLGLAYSLAVAPPSMTPDGLPVVRPGDVESVAVDAGYAGQRTFLRDTNLRSLEVFMLDLLGNREDRSGIDELRRASDKGRAMGVALGELLRSEQAAAGLGAADLWDHYVESVSYTAPHVAAMVRPAGGLEAPVLEIRREVEGTMTYLAYPSGEPQALRSLPFGEVLGVAESAGGVPTVPMALVGRVGSEALDIRLHNTTSGTASGRLTALVPSDLGMYREVDTGIVELPAGAVWSLAVSASTPDDALVLRDAFTGVAIDLPSPISVRTVDLPPFRLIGSRRDLEPDVGTIRTTLSFTEPPNRNRDLFGTSLSLLFNRPPDRASAELPEHYAVGWSFDGFDIEGESVQKTGVIGATGAFRQPSGRVVIVRYGQPLNPMRTVDDTGPLVVHTNQIQTSAIVDRWANQLDPALPDPDPSLGYDHVGSLLSGRVIRGNGAGVEGATVQLIRTCSDPPWFTLEVAGETTTSVTGEYFFEFAERDHPTHCITDTVTLRAHVPAGDDPDAEPAAIEEVSTTLRRDGLLTRINIALLGRGGISGRLVWADTGGAVVDGIVTVASAVFGGIQKQEIEGDGSFRFGGVPVGPVTVSGQGPEGERAYATVEIRGPGDHRDVVLRLPRGEVPATGIVSARVFQRSGDDPDGPPEFVAGARVSVYARGELVATGETNPQGFYFAQDVPEGPVTVQAALWEVSRTSAVADTILVAGTTAEVELTLVASSTRTVTGRVLYHDPASNTEVPVAGIPVFIGGPGVSTFTDNAGLYRLEGVPTQGITDLVYAVEAIDYSRSLWAAVDLPPIVDTSPDVVLAADLVLKERRTTIQGLVLDPLGNPASGVDVEFVGAGYWFAKVRTDSDGRFSAGDLPDIGQWTVVAHKGSGLNPPFVGWFDDVDVATFAGLTSFAPLSLRGGGTIRLTVRTQSGPVEDAWVFVKRTVYKGTSYAIGSESGYAQLETDPTGLLTFDAPVGPVEIVVYHPFYGRRDLRASVDWFGQVSELEAVFSDAATVQGQVVDVDGVTPVPGADVLLVTKTLHPQPLTTDALGRFRYELVPEGMFRVEATATVGAVERHGQVWGTVGPDASEFDITVGLEAMGTVRGQVVDDVNGTLTPLPYARVRLAEGGFPHRVFPSDDGWTVCDGDGRFEFGGVSAGEFSVLAQHPADSNRRALGSGAVESDWQIVEIEDLILSTNHGTIEILVRDPETGAPLADCPVTLSDSAMPPRDFGGVTGADGRVTFIAVPLGTYRVAAFHPPSGRNGRRDWLRLDEPLEHLDAVIEVDHRGEIRGVVWDDEAMTTPVSFGVVQLEGNTRDGWLRAMASTSMEASSLGAYEFLGIPEGQFNLTATSGTSNRLGRAAVTLSASAPVADDVNLVLEPIGSVHVRLFERLSGADVELDPATGVFAVQLTLEAQAAGGSAYQATLVAPTNPYPGHGYRFDDILLGHAGVVTVQEMSGQRRTAVADLEAEDLQAAQSPASPLRVVLDPMGVVRLTVIDENAAPVPGADVVLTPDRRAPQPLRADELGRATYTAVPGGTFTVTAQGGVSGWGGRASGVIANDDDVLDLVIQLQVAHSIEGRIVAPSLGDVSASDPSTWVPVPGAVVSLSQPVPQVMLTDDEGRFRFDALPGAGFEMSVSHPTSDGIGSASGVFSGSVTDLGTIVLDIDTPRLISVAPPNGMERVSRSARVQLTLSEPLADQWLRGDGTVNTGAFGLARADGSEAPGSWSWSTSVEGLPVVTFTPSQPYASDELYGVRVSRWVSDRAGRVLGADIGSSFRTADTEGPEVLSTVPNLARPFAEDGILRVDFNEALYAASDDPLVVAAAGTVEWLNDLGEWSEVPHAAYFTREHYSFAIDPLWEGFDLTGDTQIRRVSVRDLADHDGNTMTVWSSVFRMRDENAPSVDDLAMLPDLVGGAIDAGTPVVITPEISGIDAFGWIGGAIDPPLPQGDVDRVEYFFTEPVDGLPADVTVATHPWSLEFVAAYVGDGVTPRPLSIWCRAVDTSTNVGDAQRLDLEIHPNQTPEISSVVAEATAPVAGVFYAGSTIAATVLGLADMDGAQLSLWADLRLGDGTFIDSVSAITVSRPVSGLWSELSPPVLQLTLSPDVPEGAVFRVHVTAADSLGAEITVASSDLAVADDTEPPQLSDLVARRASTGEIDSRFTIGEAFTLEARIADLQTAVARTRIALDRTDLFPEPVSLIRVGVSDVYRSDELVAPVNGVTDAETVTATVEADDLGGNTGVAVMPFEVAPEDDPEIPTVEWLTPWHGALWPAGYESVVAPGEGVALALTVRVEDRTLNGETPAPGEVAVVEIRGPVVAAGGGVELAATPVTATVVPGTASPGAGDFQTIWRIPDSVSVGTALPFEVRAVDTGGHSVVRTIEMVAVESRKVYEAVNTAVDSDDDMTAPSGVADGTIFLLDGSKLAVYPLDDGAARDISDVALYTGGQPHTGAAFASVLSAPEVSSSASSVLFHPLNLRVTGTVAVGYGSSIDVSGDGLLGCDGSGCVTLPGGIETGDAAGGSHGGLGWFGSPNRGWDRSDLTRPAPSYGNLRAPVLPGGGGGAHDQLEGGRGGGVVRIDAAGAVVHLAGSLLANGRTGDAGGGAGGSIWITARELRGRGATSAHGAPGADPNRYGGGSGGRISVVVDEPADADGIAARCTASGAGRGGAGTVYIETVAPGAEPSGMGLLRLTQSEAGAVTPLPAVVEASVTEVRPDDRIIVAGEVLHGDPSGSLLVVRSTGGIVAILPIERVQNATEIVVSAETAELQTMAGLLAGGDALTAHSREHVSSLAVEGPVRLATDAELAVSADSPVLDDRSALDLTDGARVRLRNEEPTFTITATPLPDTDVRVGSTVTAIWSVSDPLGVWMVEHQWPFDGGPRIVPYAAVPVDVVDDSDGFPISAMATPGPVDLESTYTTLDGRVVGSILRWTILDNAQPTITLALADGAPSTVPAGATTQLVAHAEDLEGLAAIRVTNTGPSTMASRVFPVSGLVIDQLFDVTALANADGTEPIIVTAEVEDISGAVMASASVSIDVIADTAEPEVSIELTPIEVGDVYVSGRPVTITVSATDDTDVSDLSAVFDGVTRTSSGQAIQWNWIAPFVESATDFVIEAESHDPSGNLGAAQRTIVVEPSDNPNAPVVRYGCAADRRSVVAGLQTAVTVSLADDDDIDTYRVLIDGVPVGDSVTVHASSLSTNILWTPPGDAEIGATFLMTVEATDFAGNTGAASTFLEVIAGDVLYEGGTLVGSQTTGRDLILAGGIFTADGTIMPTSLTLISGATLTTPIGVPLTVLADDVTVECSAAIDVTGKGYRNRETYPGTPMDPTIAGGSHLGVGGSNEVPGSTYGSVTRPQEMGSGASGSGDQSLGGGTIRLAANTLRVDGTVASRGAMPAGPYGAGGSIWLTVDGEISGRGSIDARGGSDGIYMPGGGGAIAIEFSSVSGSVLDNAIAFGGNQSGTHNSGGAGTVFLFNRAVSEFGDLVVDNGSLDGWLTRLPRLGKGVAGSNTAGSVLETNEVSVPAYFEGHWIEITDGGTSEPRGIWRVAGIAGGALTLEANDTEGEPIVAPGDGWRGIYRFDAISVRGGALLLMPEDDRVDGVITVDAESSVLYPNQGGPEVDGQAISLVARDAAFWIEGSPGAITDLDGLASVAVRNDRTGESTPLAVDSDGSFAPVVVAGASGDHVLIDAVDGHLLPESSMSDVGELPHNGGPPVLAPELIQFSATDGSHIRVEGLAGSVSDEHGLGLLYVDNLESGSSTAAIVSSDGSFTVNREAGAGDAIQLRISDKHPEPLASVLILGEVPDVTPPQIDESRLRIGVWAQEYRIWSTYPVFEDDGGAVSAYVFEHSSPDSHYTLNVSEDGAVTSSLVRGPENGVLTIVATDLSGNSRELVLSQTLPENDGPPTVNAGRVRVFGATDRFVVDDRVDDSGGDVCAAALYSDDRVSRIEWSLRTPPFDAHIEPSYSSFNGCYDLDPVEMVGAYGDPLWIHVVDDHPHSQEVDIQVRTLGLVPGAPVVDLGKVVIHGIDGIYRVSGATNSVIDAEGPISITVTAWRQTGEVWATVDEATVSIDSGASFVAELSAALEGDSVILTVADSAAGGPYVNRYRQGLLPAMTYAPTIDPAKFALDLSGCTPRLVAETGAVTSMDETISVEVSVTHPDLGDLEDNESFAISSGQAFVADIAEIEPGSAVQLWASAQVATSAVVATAPMVPVVHVDELELLRFEWGGLRLGIEGPDITDRVNPVEIRLTNLHPDRSATVSATLPCDGGWGEAVITAQPGDLLQMEACNGNYAQVCTGPIDLGGTPIGKKRVLDIGGRGVTDLHRRGSGVLISMNDGNGRWLLTTDLWMEHRELTPPRGDVSDVFAPSWWGLGVVDGPAVYYWDNGNGVENTLLPFGEAVDVDAALERQNHLFVAGGDGIDLLFGAVAVDGRDGRIQCAPPSIAVLESGTSARALALLPLGAARLGVLVDGTTSSGDGPPRIVAVDSSNPWNPVVTEEDTSLVLNPAPESAVVDARLDQGELVLETTNGEFLIYTAVHPWEWEQRASFGSRNGAWPTVATIWGAAAWVGYDNGDVVGFALTEGFNANPPEVAALVHPNDPVSGIVTGNRALVVGLATGLVAYELEADAIQPELHASAVRANAQTVSLAAGAAWFGQAGADLRAFGTGVDGVGTPTAASVDLGYLDSRNWSTVTVDLPSDASGVFDVQWDTLTVVDRGSGYEDSILLSDTVEGPPFLDPNCHPGVFSCGITTGAAGPGWRASGPDFQYPNWLRYRWTEGNGWNQHGFPSNSEISHIEGFGNVLLAASNELLVADLATVHGPNLVGRTPFGGAPLGPVAFAANGTLAVVSTATGLELAVVDLADPRNPWIVTAAQVVGNGLGTVTDLHNDGEGSLWILTTEPDRIHRLDSAQLPNLVLLESMDLDPSGMPVALDTGRFDSEWGADLAAMFIVRRGVGLEMVDRQSLESGVLDEIPITGDARDVFVGDLNGGMRILVAAGFDRSVVEVRWNDSDLSWSELWLADLGHVRGFAYAADAYRDGQEWPETCQDFSHVDVKSMVPADGTPRLYAITDSGILHVETDLRAGGFGAPALTVVPELISLDLSGCQPTLRGLPGAAMGNGTLSVSVQVDNEAHPYGNESWWSDPQPLTSGAAFDIPLYSVDAGSVIRLTVIPELGASQMLVVDTIADDRSFDVDFSGVVVSFGDGYAGVELPFDALPWRLQDVQVSVWGDVADGGSTSGNCPDTTPFAVFFSAEPSDTLWMQVCTGTTEDYCDTEVIYENLKSRPGSNPATE